jgi:Ca-activated chloride channel homolog
MHWPRLLLPILLVIQDPYTLKLDVPVVSIDVTVVDSKDNLVNHLTQDDFLIYENGVRQTIRFFSPVSAPYNVFLLFDSSGSTRNNRDFMKDAVSKLVENLRPQDSIAMGSFDDDFKLHLGWSTDREKAFLALRTIMRPHESNGTRFYAALDRTLRREFKGIIGRRAVVVLTDGLDTPFFYESTGDLKRVLQSTRDQRIPVYLVALRSDAASRVIFPNTLLYLDAIRVNMQHLVDNSGGEILFPKDLTDVTRLYEQIGQRLGTSYSLGFVPLNAKRDESFRKIEVKARNTALRLTQSRTGYYAMGSRN